MTLTRPLTRPLTRSITRSLTQPGAGGGGFFNPVSLFSGGTGLFISATNAASLFQDTAGTTPVTTAGQTAQRVNDLSGGGNYTIQATGAAAPLYGVDTDGTPYLDMSTARALYTAAALNLSASDKLSVVVWFDSNASSAARMLVELSDNISGGAGRFYFTRENAVSQGPGFALNGTGLVARYPGAADTAAFIGAYSCLFDIGAAGVATEVIPAINRASRTWTNVGTAAGTGNFASTHALNIGARDADGARSVPLNAKVYGLFVRTGTLTADELNDLTVWGYREYGMTSLAAIGDSTVAAYLGTTAVQAYVTKAMPTNIAVPGNTIAQQKTAWQTLSASVRASHEAVVIQIGLNDLNPAEAASVAIARLQDLVDTVVADVLPECQVYIAKMIPCRARLISVYGATDGPIAYQKWLDMNEAIAGVGATPITGVYGRITAHEPLMNDGSGNLLGAYDTGDGVHPNNAGRQVNADAWRDALVAGSLLKVIP